MISRGTRVALDIKAGNPVILVPRSAKSSHVLVADLGNLTLSNEFLWQGSLGTLGYSSARSRAQYQTEFGKLFGNHVLFLQLKSLWVSFVSRELESESAMLLLQLKLTFFTSAFLCPGPTRSPHICLLESMHIELVDMDLFTAVRIEANSQTSSVDFSYKSQVWCFYTERLILVS